MNQARRTLFVVFVWLSISQALRGADHRVLRTVDENWTPQQRVAKMLHYFDWDDFVTEKQAIEKKLQDSSLSPADLEGLKYRISEISRKQENLIFELEELRKKSQSKNIEILLDKMKSRSAQTLGLRIRVAQKERDMIISQSEKSLQEGKINKEYSDLFKAEKVPFRPVWVPPVQRYIEPK